MSQRRKTSFAAGDVFLKSQNMEVHEIFRGKFKRLVVISFSRTAKLTNGSNSQSEVLTVVADGTRGLT